ncbi:MAG TPA: adenylosuccinate synthase [Streptosporangiaceae bacterium]|nr:adenylosuccinate synthase [Streptosporangiaceae bacterium]
MSAIVVVGTQWGDEGKGKVTDLLGGRVNYVVRYQGGNNAGHTVVVGEESYALHLLPSGVLSPEVTPVIGNGVVIDPEVLLAEIDGLEGRGVSCDRLLISASAHLIMPHHRALDRVTERYLGNARIGTTGRGIGPTYADKVARTGIRVQDLFDPGILRQKLDLVLREKNQMLAKVYNRRAIAADAVTEEYVAYGERLRPYVADTTLILNKALDAGETVLLEGAQATLLDVDHGTYPFVTSSSPTAGGACVGSGIGPTRITSVIGVAKAYVTRVGSGPFPTELDNERGEWLRKAGGEYGVTTGRPRRTGWFDAVVARYAARVNGITDFFLTKLDVLSGLEKVPVCVAYEVGGTRHADMPMTQTEFHHARPVYEYFDGWWEDISHARQFADLPSTAQAYVRALEEMIGAPVAGVGIGPRRDQTLQVRPLIQGSAATAPA